MKRINCPGCGVEMEANPIPFESKFVDVSTYESRSVICKQTFRYNCNKCKKMQLSLTEEIVFVPEVK